MRGTSLWLGPRRCGCASIATLPVRANAILTLVDRQAELDLNKKLARFKGDADDNDSIPLILEN